MSSAATERVALISRRARARDEHSISGEPVIGKDILELLSSAMYLDARTVYREYVQNSADAIDDAFATNVLSSNEKGRVDVTLDTATRTVRIRDNGTGVTSADAERVLTSFGASAKRGKSARGFRGVGRLAAFGYAQTVSFKTKTAGESVSTEVRWDCRKLKSALLDPNYKGDLRQIVRDVVTVIVEEEPNTGQHYFEVVLEKVVRIRNDVLLNPDEVGRYLSEVVPAPFHRDFPFGAEIDEHLRPYLAPCNFRVFINAAEDPITRPHRGEFAVSATKTDSASEVERLTLQTADGRVQAVGWILHHSYLGAIHGADDIRGLRARVGDIQIGTGDLFVDSFPEPRFNSWTIGEIHVVDPKIVPNGRRDSFEQSAAYADLLAQIVLVARRQATKCRQSSARRNRLKSFEIREKRVHELFGTLGHSGKNQTAQLRIRRQIGAVFGEMKRLAGSRILTDADQARLKRRIGNLEARFDGLKSIAAVSDPFAETTPVQRAAYEQMIDLIYDCSPKKNVARLLVDRIMARLAAQAVRARKRRKRRTS